MGGFSTGLKETAEVAEESLLRKYGQSFEAYASRFPSGKWLVDTLGQRSAEIRIDTEAFNEQSRIMGHFKDIDSAKTPLEKQKFSENNKGIMKSNRILATSVADTKYLGKSKTRLAQAVSNVRAESKNPLVAKNIADMTSTFLREQGWQDWRKKAGISTPSPYHGVEEGEHLVKNILNVGFLSKIVIPHFGQPLYTLLNTGAKTWLEAFAAIAHDPQAAYKMAERTGALFEEQYRALQDMAAGKDTVWHKVIHMPLFQKTREWQIVHAAIAGKYAAEDAFSASSKFADIQLKMLGIDPLAARARGYLTEDEKLTAGFKSADETFFIERGLKTPTMWEATATSRMLTLYKSFSFRAQKFLKDALKRSASDPAEFAKRLVILGTVFPVVGEMVQGLYNISDAKSPFNRDNIAKPTGNAITDEVINAYSHVGALGITYNLYRALMYGRTSDWLAGPAIALPVDVLTAGRAIAKGKPKQAIKRLSRRIPIVGGAISSNIQTK